MILATASKSSGGGSPIFLIGLILVIGLFFLMTRQSRNRQRRAATAQNEAVPGQRIVTTAGMYGTIISGDAQNVVIEVAPGVHVTMLRRAIMRVVPDDEEAGQPGDAMPSPDGRVETDVTDAPPAEHESDI
jgi:preprotein translocase subunit YajC